MTRQIFVHQIGPEDKPLARLEQTELVWEAAYDVVMRRPDLPRLNAFWLHYYGSDAEMRFDGDALAQLRDELQKLLQEGVALSPSTRKFFDAFHHLCRRAIQRGAYVAVIAD